jgi:hypothetical protein
MTTRRGGLWLIVAAATFWPGWLLMPDAGTNDAPHILEVVRANRAAVWWSVVLHLVASVALVVGVVGVQSHSAAAGACAAQWGACLVLIGALGTCADAFFHLMAYYLTADGVEPGAVLEPMRLLQTQGVAFLAPLLLALVAGGWLYSAGLRRAGVLSSAAWWAFVAAVVTALVGGAVVAGSGQGRRAVSLTVLGLVALGYARIGWEFLAFGPGRGAPTVPDPAPNPAI